MNKNPVKSFIISSIIVFCAAIIESSILSNINFLLVVPDLVLICTIYFALLNGKTYGELSGFVSGLTLDFITGVPFGLNCVFRTIIGYAYGWFAENIIISGIFLPMIFVAFGTFAKKLLLIVISLVFPRISLHIYGFISSQFLFEFIENVVLAPFVFKFLSFFRNTLSIKDTKDMIDNV